MSLTTTSNPISTSTPVEREPVKVCFADYTGRRHHVRDGRVERATQDPQDDDDGIDHDLDVWAAWASGFVMPGLKPGAGLPSWCAALVAGDHKWFRIVITRQNKMPQGRSVYLKGVRLSDGTELGDCSAIANLEALAAEICDAR